MCQYTTVSFVDQNRRRFHMVFQTPVSVRVDDDLILDGLNTWMPRMKAAFSRQLGAIRTGQEWPP
jgi:hypothetical protein